VAAIRRWEHDVTVKIVVRHNEAGQWWWAVLGEGGETIAVSVPLTSKTACAKAIAELKVEGPFAPVAYEQDAQAAKPGTWTISSLIPSGS
jgi:uncharacterized protein YegP (UPF0339 family)